VLAIVCTAALFFFPAVRGPYSSVHGPVTALRSVSAKLTMWLLLALAALRVLGCRLPGYDALFTALRHEFLLPRSSPPSSLSVLRC
jgi:hypothetical protein